MESSAACWQSVSQPPLRYQPYARPIGRVAEEPPMPRQRTKVNLRERNRNMAINDAFYHLQRLIPYAPVDQKLPKIKTLRLAVHYIGFLARQLHTPPPPADSPPKSLLPWLDRSPADFAQIVAAEVQARNSYKQRAESLVVQNGRCVAAEPLERLPSEPRPSCSPPEYSVDVRHASFYGRQPF